MVWTVNVVDGGIIDTFINYHEELFFSDMELFNEFMD